MQIVYYKSLIDKTPYEDKKLDTTISNVKILDENRFVFSTTNEILHRYGSKEKSLLLINDTINCFDYNEKSHICAAHGEDSTLYIIQPTQDTSLKYFSDSITYIKVFIDKIIIVSRPNNFSILNMDGEILKQLKLGSTIINCFSDENQTFLICSDSIIYKYDPDLDSISPVCQKTHPNNGKIFINSNSIFYTTNNNTSITYFNFSNPVDTLTISYLNKIRDHTICNKMLVVLCYDGNYYFRNLETNNEFVLKCASKVPDVLKFRYNSNKTFVVINKDGSVLKYNLKLFDFVPKQVNMTEISAVYMDDDFEIIGSFNNPLSIYNQKTFSFLIRNVEDITAIDISNKFEIIATSSHDHSIRIWDFEGNVKDSIIFDNGGVRDLKIINGKYKLLAACKNSIVYLWDLESKKYRSFRGHNKMVDVLDVSEKLHIFISGSRDSTIIIWDYESEKPLIRKLKHHKGLITDIEISPDSKRFISSSKDGSIILWDIDGNLIKKYIGHSDKVQNICWLSDNSFVSSSRDNTCCIWNTNGDIIDLFKDNSSHVSEIIYNDLENKLYLFFINGEVRTYDL